MTPRPLLAAAVALTLAVVPAPADWHGHDAGRDAETAPDPSYYPLHVGDTWTYSLGGTRFEMKVVRHERFAGTTCARVEMQLDGRTMSHEHVAVRDGGVYRFGFEGAQADPPVLFLKLPARPVLRSQAQPVLRSRAQPLLRSQEQRWWQEPTPQLLPLRPSVLRLPAPLKPVRLKTCSARLPG